MNADRLQRYGPWAVVTGASDGIGREFARALAADGFRLVLVARRAAELDRLAQELAPAEVRVLATDLATEHGIAALEAQTAELDVGLLVAAAGYGSSGDLLDRPIAGELQMIDLNCRAVAALSYSFGHRLRRRGRGGLVLFSSLVAFQGVARSTTYAATKAWVQSFAEGLALELRPHGIEVLSVAPGPVTSGFAARAAMTMTMTDPPAVVARGALRALRRGGTVRPGRVSKLLGWSLAMLPRWARVLLMARIMAGMTRPPQPAPVTAQT